MINSQPQAEVDSLRAAAHAHRRALIYSTDPGCAVHYLLLQLRRIKDTRGW